MAHVVIFTRRDQGVLPSIELLEHRVTTLPGTAAAVAHAPDADLTIVDGAVELRPDDVGEQPPDGRLAGVGVQPADDHDGEHQPFFPYRRSKRSTRPAVSRTRAVPV